MNESFKKVLQSCEGQSILNVICENIEIKNRENDFNIILEVKNGVKIGFSYWRIIDKENSKISFLNYSKVDDLTAFFKNYICNKVITFLILEEKSKDLLITLNDGSLFQVLVLSNYEDWNFIAMDGKIDYPNFLD